MPDICFRYLSLNLPASEVQFAYSQFQICKLGNFLISSICTDIHEDLFKFWYQELEFHDLFFFRIILLQSWQFFYFNLQPDEWRDSSLSVDYT